MCYFHKFVFSPDLKSNISSFYQCLKQFATSFKMFLDNWNIQTALWLKRWTLEINWIILTEHVCTFWNLRNNVSFVAVLCRVCYERCPYNPTAATFLLSAIWHGVYPGYYLTFVTGIVVTMAARAVSILYSCFHFFKPKQEFLNPTYTEYSFINQNLDILNIYMSCEHCNLLS